MSIDMMIDRDGNVRMIYDESIDAHAIGKVEIRRGSHVEPTPEGGWMADLSPVAGPMLGPFGKRSQAIDAEVAWLRAYWLVPTG